MVCRVCGSSIIHLGTRFQLGIDTCLPLPSLSHSSIPLPHLRRAHDHHPPPPARQAYPCPRRASGQGGLQTVICVGAGGKGRSQVSDSRNACKARVTQDSPQKLPQAHPLPGITELLITVTECYTAPCRGCHLGLSLGICALRTVVCPRRSATVVAAFTAVDTVQRRLCMLPPLGCLGYSGG